jgi:hypothetical protein
MEKELIRAFHKAKYEGKPDLAENIWHNLVRRDKQIVRLKLWAFSFAGLISFLGLIPAWKALLSNLTQSGVYEYFSLIFSNGSSVLSYWKELALSIAESLPLMSIILSLSLVFILFLSLKYVTRQIIKNQSLLSLSF